MVSMALWRVDAGEIGLCEQSLEMLTILTVIGVLHFVHTSSLQQSSRGNLHHCNGVRDDIMGSQSTFTALLPLLLSGGVEGEQTSHRGRLHDH